MRQSWKGRETPSILRRTAVAVAFVAAALVIAAPPGEARNKRLSAPYTYTVGDDIALRMESVFRKAVGLEDGSMAYYDRTTFNLVVDIFGSTDDVEAAKQEMKRYLALVQEEIAPYARKRYGITLAESDVTLVFHNDTGDEPPYEVVRWENGVFTEPAAEGGE